MYDHKVSSVYEGNGNWYKKLKLKVTSIFSKALAKDSYLKQERQLKKHNINTAQAFITINHKGIMFLSLFK